MPTDLHHLNLVTLNQLKDSTWSHLSPLQILLSHFHHSATWTGTSAACTSQSTRYFLFFLHYQFIFNPTAFETTSFLSWISTFSSDSGAPPVTLGLTQQCMALIYDSETMVLIGNQNVQEYWQTTEKLVNFRYIWGLMETKSFTYLVLYEPFYSICSNISIPRNTCIFWLLLISIVKEPLKRSFSSA